MGGVVFCALGFLLVLLEVGGLFAGLALLLAVLFCHFSQFFDIFIHIVVDE
jgi:hypothetical protein